MVVRAQVAETVMAWLGDGEDPSAMFLMIGNMARRSFTSLAVRSVVALVNSACAASARIAGARVVDAAAVSAALGCLDVLTVRAARYGGPPRTAE